MGLVQKSRSSPPDPRVLLLGSTYCFINGVSVILEPEFGVLEMIALNVLGRQIRDRRLNGRCCNSTGDEQESSPLLYTKEVCVKNNTGQHCLQRSGSVPSKDDERKSNCAADSVAKASPDQNAQALEKRHRPVEWAKSNEYPAPELDARVTAETKQRWLDGSECGGEDMSPANPSNGLWIQMRIGAHGGVVNPGGIIVRSTFKLENGFVAVHTIGHGKSEAKPPGEVREVSRNVYT
ncbi:hypothetical protein BOTBODRAFT_624872 [Botryobasidium botryosum FD-172 SS1]|uniref:Uncharacterized protein n=1 Tax=Botryobasidium botryosum (strain FD-172 SS1) TaxID=930990 RepID=A0A067M1Z2_BOTB1|nr:hypothetical protein BOTBODRAFT_624872 [Botryobasidium botryosum FD-172 SS1]